MKPRVHFLTGFLGTGKTTLVNSMLGLYRDKRVAVLVNEFGETGVDARRIDSPAVTELNNGQIFCSCLAGQFVDAMLTILQREPAVVLVETSGLAKPSSLGSILQVITDRGPSFDYAGMTCVIDAERYHALSRTVNAVSEQVRYSDRFVINKMDRVTAETVQAIESDIRAVHPSAAVAKTSYCVVDEAFFAGSAEVGTVPASEACFLGWGDLGRPEAAMLDVPDRPVRQDELRNFLESNAAKVLRIKGSIDAGEGRVDVDVTDTVAVSLAVEPVGVATGLVVIAARDQISGVRKSWRNLVAAAASTETIGT